MTLLKWLVKKRMSLTQFSQQTGLALSTVSKISRGKNRPDWTTMDVIYDFTKGEVPPNDFRDQKGMAN